MTMPHRVPEVMDNMSTALGAIAFSSAGVTFGGAFFDPSILDHTSVIMGSGAALLAAVGKFAIDVAKAAKIHAEAERIKLDCEEYMCGNAKRCDKRLDPFDK